MISAKDLYELEIVLPSIEEQDRIVKEYYIEKLNIENEIRKLEKKLKMCREKVYKNMNIGSCYEIREEKVNEQN